MKMIHSGSEVFGYRELISTLTEKQVNRKKLKFEVMRNSRIAVSFFSQNTMVTILLGYPGPPTTCPAAESG